MSKILIIDDDPLLLEMTQLMLEDRGFEVITACDSADGVAKARQQLPDLILCDINMDTPRAGYTTLSQLHEDATTAAIPFIIMTGEVDPPGQRHAMESGADDYLRKPFRLEECYAAVEARLKKSQTIRHEAESKFRHLRDHISLMLPHEMRTPLNGIISNAELLATAAEFPLPPPEIAEMGREISTSAQRLERLIENFLVYAQLELLANDAEGIKVLRQARTLQPAKLLRQAAAAQAERPGRAADLAVEAVDVPLPMAEDYFKKIITELVQNAFKYSSAGSPVEVRLAPAGEAVELTVRDAGLGFSPEQIRRIDAYVQFERKMQDDQGMGLGLAIAKKLVTLHGGSLDLASATGAGSTITVRLPAVKTA